MTIKQLSCSLWRQTVRTETAVRTTVASSSHVTAMTSRCNTPAATPAGAFVITSQVSQQQSPACLYRPQQLSVCVLKYLSENFFYYFHSSGAEFPTFSVFSGQLMARKCVLHPFICLYFFMTIRKFSENSSCGEIWTKFYQISMWFDLIW